MLFRLMRLYLQWKGYVVAPRTDNFDWVPERVRAMDPVAMQLVKEWDKAPSSGEFKRGRVYGRMIKKFPDARPRDISWAIERAVRTLP